MELSIVTVTWKSKELIGDFINSINEQTKGISFEIILVENNSGDGIADFVRSNFPEVKIIENDWNAGYARAMNQGYEISSGEYIVFMNPDMRLVENTFPILINKLKADSKIGIIAPTLIYADGRVQPTVKRNPTLLSQLLILTKLHRLIQPATLQNYLAKDFDYSKEQEALQLMGAFIMSPRAAVVKYGGWDNDYPLWWEDVQLCQDSLKAGFKNIYTPDTKVVHYQGRSFAKVVSVTKQQKFNRGMRIYFLKNYGYLPYLLLLALHPFSMILAMIGQRMKIKPMGQDEL